MSDIARVPFHGDEILIVDQEGRPHVILKPAFEAIGLDPDRQIAKIQRQPWSTTAVTAVVAADGKTRDMVTADVRTFLMALATVPAARVAEHVRPKLIAYQCETADAIEAYWTRSHPASPGDPTTWTWDEVCCIVEQRYGISMTVHELCRMLRTAGVLKQTGLPMKKYRHLFWHTGSTLNVHPHNLPQLAHRLFAVGRELQDFRFIQGRLELEGVGLAELDVDERGR